MDKLDETLRFLYEAGMTGLAAFPIYLALGVTSFWEQAAVGIVIGIYRAIDYKLGKFFYGQE